MSLTRPQARGLLCQGVVEADGKPVFRQSRWVQILHLEETIFK